MPERIQTVYAINDLLVMCPDGITWTPILVADALSGLQKRSPYWTFEWRKTVADRCLLDWPDYDNTRLTSLTCPPPHELQTSTRYTDVVCKAITFTRMHNNAQDVRATFEVYVG